MTDSSQRPEPRKHFFLDRVEFPSVSVSGNARVACSVPPRQPLRVGFPDITPSPSPPSQPPIPHPRLGFRDGSVKSEGVWLSCTHPSVRHLTVLGRGGDLVTILKRVWEHKHLSATSR